MRRTLATWYTMRRWCGSRDIYLINPTRAGVLPSGYLQGLALHLGRTDPAAGADAIA